MYVLDCMGCHVEDGPGAGGKVPSMRETLVPFATSPRGRRYLLQVPGVAQSSRTDRELAQLLNWMIRNLSDVPVPATFVEFTAAEVAAARSTALQDAATIRATLIAELVASSSRQATQHSPGVEP